MKFTSIQHYEQSNFQLDYQAVSIERAADEFSKACHRGHMNWGHLFLADTGELVASWTRQEGLTYLKHEPRANAANEPKSSEEQVPSTAELLDRVRALVAQWTIDGPTDTQAWGNEVAGLLQTLSSRLVSVSSRQLPLATGFAVVAEIIRRLEGMISNHDIHETGYRSALEMVKWVAGPVAEGAFALPSEEKKALAVAVVAQSFVDSAGQPAFGKFTWGDLISALGILASSAARVTALKSAVQRYELKVTRQRNGVEMAKDAQGGWVSYSDHLAALAARQ